MSWVSETRFYINLNHWHINGCATSVFIRDIYWLQPTVCIVNWDWSKFKPSSYIDFEVLYGFDQFDDSEFWWLRIKISITDLLAVDLILKIHIDLIVN